MYLSSIVFNFYFKYFDPANNFFTDFCRHKHKKINEKIHIPIIIAVLHCFH